MTATVAGIHGGLDIHANRPAGNAVPDGSLYSCSTHGLIYKSNLAGNSWATYATLGSTGSVATDAIWDAKGDLAGGTGADTAAKLTVGANDTILMADSAQSTGLKWVASQTPSTQAFSDAAAEGTADTYARGDHKHAMPANPGGSLASDTATVATTQTTTSSSFTDLSTSGPTVTVTVNTKVMVIVSCEFSSASAAQYGAMGFAASSGNTVAAARAKALIECTGDDGSSSTVFASSRIITLTGLTPGSTVFTAKYASLTGGTVSFSNRDITVVCLN